MSFSDVCVIREGGELCGAMSFDSAVPPIGKIAETAYPTPLLILFRKVKRVCNLQKSFVHFTEKKFKLKELFTKFRVEFKEK